MRGRPLGITFLGFLYVLVGLGLMLVTYYAIAVLRVIPQALAPFVAFPETLLYIAIALATVHFLVAYGLWTLRPWARQMVIAFSAIGLVIGLVTLPVGVFVLVLNAANVWYVNGREVRRAFDGARVR